MQKLRFGLTLAYLSGLGACAHQDHPTSNQSSIASEPTKADAKAFADAVNRELKQQWTDAGYADWVMNTHITDDTEYLATRAMEKVLGYSAKAIKQTAAFKGLELDSETNRTLHLLKVSSAIVAPEESTKQKRLAEIAAKMTSIYGKGKHCGSDAGKDKKCRDLGQLSAVIASSRDYDELLDAWQGWRTISRPMKSLYEEFATLSNEGAKEVGFQDSGELWRAAYDMSPSDFEKETERLWNEVSPLYEDLHCYVRSKLKKTYGEKVPESGAIPAHLLGNMWAQEWSNVFDLVKPYGSTASINVSAALQSKDFDALKMTRLSESFFTSLGMKKLPESFWKNSMFTKPPNRDVVCHASAWDVNFSGDLRIKMCININEEDLITIHHELGHIYYYVYYNTLPFLYQNGAHDGFHEAIGDAIALSVTPDYLKKVGVLDKVAKDEKALINFQLKKALDKVAFLPFGKMIDEWRWKVFSGETTAKDYNANWWKLREKYQGIKAPVARSETDFDPGAKYHIPANVPYTRYFLAHILQFQFHEALCKAAGHTGPLHECSIYESKEAGDRLIKMLSLGASKPWPDALEALTSTREMSAKPLLNYFAPLSQWLKAQNKGQKCGW